MEEFICCVWFGVKERVTVRQPMVSLSCAFLYHVAFSAASSTYNISSIARLLHLVHLARALFLLKSKACASNDFFRQGID